MTTHEIDGKVRGTAGQWRLLHRFQGETSDGHEIGWAKPIAGIEVVKVVTTSSPSWVGPEP